MKHTRRAIVCSIFLSSLILEPSFAVMKKGLIIDGGWITGANKSPLAVAEVYFNDDGTKRIVAIDKKGDRRIFALFNTYNKLVPIVETIDDVPRVYAPADYTRIIGLRPQVDNALKARGFASFIYNQTTYRYDVRAAKK